MANVQHSTLSGASVHEDKLITTATTADAGKVTTPSSITNGVGTLRKLTPADVDQYEMIYQAELTDVSTADTEYLRTVAPVKQGTVYVVLKAGITVADDTVTVIIGGNATPVTITQAGSVAGSTFSANFSFGAAVAANSAITVTCSGASTGPAKALVLIYAKRS